MASSIGSVPRAPEPHIAPLASAVQLAGVQPGGHAGQAIAGAVASDRSGTAIIEFQQSIRGANNGISLLQTADGSLGSINENLLRFRQLALQAVNGTLSGSDRAALNAEALQLRDEINRIVAATEFNGQPLLRSDSTLTIQSGGNGIDLQINNIQQQLTDLNFEQIDLGSSGGAEQALAILDSAQQLINRTVGTVGSTASRLDSSINALQTSLTDAEATRARIASSDSARQVADQSRNDLLLQAGLAIQSQANLRSELVLRLLNG